MAEPAPSLRIIIADDDYLLREGTARLLSYVAGVDVLETVGTAEALVDAVRRLRPDAVLTDIRMPPGHQMEGIEAAHAIRRDHPGVGVVVLSHHAAPAYAMELFREGTAGLAYLLKERIGDVEEVVRALRETAEGGSVIDPRIVEALIVRRSRGEGSRLGELSARELEVLREMARGKTNAAIAQALVLSVSAVEKYVGAIFDKLGLTEEPALHRRVAAVLAYLRSTDPDADSAGQGG
ncbi:MAG: response regulator receiver protein [Chloroflexi bacterium CSP1-4]|nr:MAG: response regulator receiver protein [Chloroflexi bacterium CSP1-4]